MCHAVIEHFIDLLTLNMSKTLRLTIDEISLTKSQFDLSCFSHLKSHSLFN